MPLVCYYPQPSPHKIIYNSGLVVIIGTLVVIYYIVYFFPTMEVDEPRNCLVTDILLNIRKSAEWIQKR